MKNIIRTFLSLLFILLAAPAFAGETVKTPNVEKGLLEIENKGRYQMDTAPARNHKKELEFSAV